MKSRPVSVNVTANGLAANQAQQTANQAVTSANKYKMAWDEANSETIAALDEAQKEFESNLAWVKSQIYEGQHQNDSAVASLRSDMESSWNSMSTVEESLYNSAITATSEVDSHLESLRVQNSLSLADLHSAANSLHAEAASLHGDVDSMRGSLADVQDGVTKAKNDLSAAKTSLAATGNSLATATSELQRQTGQISGSLSTANSMIMFNSDAIAEVKRTAGEISTTVSNIRVGGRNLLRNSDKLPFSSGSWISSWQTGQWCIAGMTNDTDDMVRTSKEITDPPQGDKATVISFTGILRSSVNDISLAAINSVPISGNVTVSFWARQTSNVNTAFVSAGWSGGEMANTTNASTERWGTTKYRKLFLPKDGSWTRFWATFNVNNNENIYIGAGNTGTSTEVQICLVKIETGTMATDWTPAPEDTDQAISKVSQTADAIRADLTNTKGDVAAVKAEADSLTTQMADATGNISQLQQTAKGLQSSVTDQSGKISQLQQDTDGLSATVGGAAIDIIPNLDQQFVMGFGIANTTWQDNNSYIKLPTTRKATEVLPQTAGFTLNIPWQAGKTYMQSIVFETDATINDSIQPKWTWLSGNGHVPANATLAKLGNNTYRLIGSHTTTAREATSQLRVFDIFNFTDFVDVTSGTYLKFRNPRIWCPDDNSLAQLKLTADGLTSKVADTQGNVSKLQQTATGLQTQMTNTQKDVSSLKVTAGEISADLTNAKGDIARVKVTADNLTTSMTNAQDNISTLQHRADSITSTLSQGGVNLLTGTSGDLKNVTASPWWIAYTDFFLTHVLDNKTCTARVWIDNPSMDVYLQIWTNKSGYWNSNTIKANKSGYATVTFKITDTSYTDAHIAIGSASGTTTFGYKELQIEYGETATPWKPSNGDISSLQQTAQGLTADMKDAKGNISSLQATASQFSTSLHDAEHNVSSLQETAKELDTQIKAVDGRATTIKETADGISARVSRIEGNNVVGSLLKLDGNEAGLGTYVNNKLIAGINTNPDGVTIDGKNIHLNGQTHIDDGVINASKITVYNTVGDNKGNQYLAVAWGQLNSTIGGKDDQGNSLWGSINQTNSKLSSYYQELKNDGSSTRSLIQQTSDQILLGVDQKIQYKTYTVSASSTWDFNLTKSIYDNWFVNGDTSGNYFYNGPDGLKPWVYIQSRGSADGTRFVTTVWRDYDPTQYQRTWTGDHWTPWVMLPNSQNLISAINLSPDSVKISGKNIELDGNTRIADGFTLSADKISAGTLNGVTITGSKFIANTDNGNLFGKLWDKYQVVVENSGIDMTGSYTIGNQETQVTTTIIGGDLYVERIENTLGSDSNNWTKSIDINTDGPNPYIKLVNSGPGPGQYSSTYIGSDHIETNDVWAGNLRIVGHHIRPTDDKFVLVSNHAGTNFDNNGSVGFQVYGGIGLGQNTIYTASRDLYIQNGNAVQNLGQSYSSANKTTIHAQNLISQVANTVSSRLSVKTAITKVTYDRALMAIQNTDMYDYRYTTDETGQHYVSGIIDDIHDNPEYNMDPMLINKERTARIDANLLGYHQVVLQEILKRLDKLEAK